MSLGLMDRLAGALNRRREPYRNRAARPGNALAEFAQWFGGVTTRRAINRLEAQRERLARRDAHVWRKEAGVTREEYQNARTQAHRDRMHRRKNGEKTHA